MKNRIIIFTIFLGFFSCLNSAFAVPEKKEMRGIWISDPRGFNWEKVISDMKKCGLNNIFVNFASAGATFYPSNILPYREPKDDFAHLIELAHKNNIYVHAKILAFFMHWASKDQITKMKKEGRLLLNTKGKIQIQSQTPWLDPSQIKNRSQLISIIDEIMSKYDVDGIQLDYVRFYEELNVPESILAIRKSILTNFVAEVGTKIKTKNKNLRYSACIFYDETRAREEMAQDWKKWVDLNIFHFYVPMNYTVSNTNLVRWINRQEHITGGQGNFYSGLAAYMEGMTPKKLIKQISLLRKTMNPGFILFSYTDEFSKNFIPELSQFLNSNN
ncbi:MAG: hypothetical protein ACD_79C01446G0003 [uncultured bacterium]|nr:MAG: hypothetical protein ACD_79C01446G0003 [uncultured bacterium]